MDSLRIDTGEKRIAINNDPSRVIVFNPSDVVFAEKFYHLMGTFQQKLTEYQSRAKELDGDNTSDANGVPVNMAARIELNRDVCEFIRNQIDALFGPGTSQTVFGDALNVEAFTQFFEGIQPFIQNARASKVQKYARKK